MQVVIWFLDTSGLIRLEILQAPLTIEESIQESKYKPIFEAELGNNRFSSVDLIISEIDLSRDEALSVVLATAQNRTDSEAFGSSTETPFSLSRKMRFLYRWDIGAFDVFNYDMLNGTKTLSTAFNQFTINSQIYSHFNDVLADNSITLLDDAALSQLRSLLLFRDLMSLK